MTICIAAIGKDDDSECIVFATDHMLTIYKLWKFEHGITKYREIDTDTVAMLSGNALLFDDIIKGTSEEKTYEYIKKRILTNFKNIKEERITEILRKYHIEEKDIKKHIIECNENELLDVICDTIIKYDLETSILLIGFNENGKAMITSISDGEAVEYRDMNFNAIGSGQIQAINTLMFQRHDKANPLTMTIYDVYKAKRNAEVHEGVGRDTDIVILRKGTGCKKLEAEDLKILDHIYEEELTQGKTHEELEKMNIR